VAADWGISRWALAHGSPGLGNSQAPAAELLFLEKTENSIKLLQGAQPIERLLAGGLDSHARQETGFMAQPHLRVYFEQEEGGAATQSRSAPRETVTVRLSDIAQLLADAVQSDRTWLYDFQDDEVTLSADLYEVMSAYRFFRRPS
jgi:hypothetical protein